MGISNRRQWLILIVIKHDECGGLIFHGKREGDHYNAAGGLTFDQFKQDEVIDLGHEDIDGQRLAGLRVWDRPDVPMPEWIERLEAILRLPREDIQKLSEWPEDALAQMRAEHLLSAPRVFVGKDRDRAAVVRLYDAEGRARLKLSVGAEGTPMLVFLDEDGQVTESYPANTLGTQGG